MKGDDGRYGYQLHLALRGNSFMLRGVHDEKELEILGILATENEKSMANERWCLGCHLCEYYCALCQLGSDMVRALKESGTIRESALRATTGLLTPLLPALS